MYRGASGGEYYTFVMVAVVALGVMGLSLLTAVPGWAQAKGPGDISAEIARAKAEFYARFDSLASDPTPNQSKYDVGYYWLDLDIDPVTETVSGTVRMVAEVVNGPLASVDVDLYDDMTVDSVVVTVNPDPGLVVLGIEIVPLYVIIEDRGIAIDADAVLLVLVGDASGHKRPVTA